MAFFQLLLLALILLVFLLLSAFFSGMESGLISLDQIALEHNAKRNRKGAALLSLVRQPDKFLGTTLIGSNIAIAILASLSTYFVARMDHLSLDARYTSLIMGIVVLIFGEIIPKALFRDRADSLVPRLYPLLMFFYYLLRPFVAMVGYLNKALRKLLKLQDNNQYDFLTKDDLTLLFAEANKGDSISAPQIEMLEDALDFKDLEARNVMVPRTEIVAIADTAKISEVIEIAKKEGFTRYPVYRGSLDDIIGILIIYDILKKEIKGDALAADIIHEPYFAPENIDLDVLLKEMQSSRRSVAIIVDAYGGTAGMLTMEDILEEIVGEIEDEYDEDEEQDVEQISPNTWIAMADVEIDRLEDDYGIVLPEGDYETVAGLILDKLERIPHPGQFITISPYRIQVLQATNKKIVKVKIHRNLEN